MVSRNNISNFVLEAWWSSNKVCISIWSFYVINVLVIIKNVLHTKALLICFPKKLICDMCLLFCRKNGWYHGQNDSSFPKWNGRSFRGFFRCHYLEMFGTPGYVIHRRYVGVPLPCCTRIYLRHIFLKLFCSQDLFEIWWWIIAFVFMHHSTKLVVCHWCGRKK